MLHAPLRPPRGFVALLGVVGLACLGAPRAVAAQSGCRFGSGSGTYHQEAIPNGGFIIRVAHPHLVCDDGAELWADSTVSFTAQHYSHLMGHVRFRDEARDMRSDDAIYHSDTSVLQAFGHLFVRDTARGSTIENGKLDYRRKTSDRPQEEMQVSIGSDLVRPVALLHIGAAEDTTAARPGAAGPAGSPDSVPPLRPGGAHAIQPDSLRAAPDTTVRPDTARAVLPDTGRAAPPQVALVAPPDTTHPAPKDTTHAAPKDTTHAPPPDSAQAGPPPLVKGLPPGGAAATPATADTARRTEPRDTTPYRVQADRLFLVGQSYFRATGSVNIDRDSLHAFADTAVYDQAGGRILLKAWAKVQSSGYDLSGDRVNIAAPGGQIRQVRAIHHAKLTGNQLDMSAPVITVLMTDGQMDRLVATPLRGEDADTVALAAPPGAEVRPLLARPRELLHAVSDSGQAGTPPDSAAAARPVASSEKFTITADSLDVRAPGQVLDKMYAVGEARGESSAGDSLNVPSLPPDARKDWIEGDTLIATFVKVEPKPDQPRDSAHYQLDRLVAQGAARSLYRIAPSDSTSRPGIDPPALHYVLGKEITIVLDSGQVDHMEVVDPKGWHLEPLTRAARDSVARDSLMRADSSKARPDTAKAPPGVAKPRPDTTRARPDTLKARPAGAGKPGSAKVRPDTMTAQPPGVGRNDANDTAVRTERSRGSPGRRRPPDGDPAARAPRGDEPMPGGRAWGQNTRRQR